MVRFIIFAILLALLSAQPGHGASVANVTSEPESITTAAQTSKPKVATTSPPVKQEVATTTIPESEVTTQISAQAPTNSTHDSPDTTPTSEPDTVIIIDDESSSDLEEPVAGVPLVRQFVWTEQSVEGLVCMAPTQFMVKEIDNKEFPIVNFQATMSEIVGKPASLYYKPPGDERIQTLWLKFKNSTNWEVEEIPNVIRRKVEDDVMSSDEDDDDKGWGKEKPVQGQHMDSESDDPHTDSAGPAVHNLDAEIDNHHICTQHSGSVPGLDCKRVYLPQLHDPRDSDYVHQIQSQGFKV